MNRNDRVYYKDTGKHDTGTVLLMSKGGTGALVKWDNNQYDCPETVFDNGNTYFDEWFNVKDLEKITEDSQSN